MKLFKTISGFILSGIVIIYILFSPFIFLSKISVENLILKEEEKSYKIIELWNIDTFEGGSVARNIFLEKRATEYQKTHQGTFFIVKNYTPEQAIINLSKGNRPSLFSYGAGFGKEILNFISPIESTYSVNENMAKSGIVNGEIMALPYISGCYVEIQSETKSDGENIVSDKVYIPQNNYVDYGRAVESLKEEICQTDLSQYDLYAKYIKDAIDTYIGTQRDLYRCINRKNNGGKGSVYKVIEDYNDLLQYLSYIDDEYSSQSQQFIKYLVSEDCQSKLINISMFNVIGKNYYAEDHYSYIENMLKKDIEYPNIFAGAR